MSFQSFKNLKKMLLLKILAKFFATMVIPFNRSIPSQGVLTMSIDSESFSRSEPLFIPYLNLFCK